MTDEGFDLFLQKSGCLFTNDFISQNISGNQRTDKKYKRLFTFSKKNQEAVKEKK